MRQNRGEGNRSNGGNWRERRKEKRENNNNNVAPLIQRKKKKNVRQNGTEYRLLNIFISIKTKIKIN